MADISSYHVDLKGQSFVRNKSHCVSNFHFSMPTWLAYKPKKALQTPMPTWLAHKPKKALQTKVNEIKARDKSDNKAIQRKADEIKGGEKKSETALEGRSWKNKKKEKLFFFFFLFLRRKETNLRRYKLVGGNVALFYFFSLLMYYLKHLQIFLFFGRITLQIYLQYSFVVVEFVLFFFFFSSSFKPVIYSYALFSWEDGKVGG